MKASCEAKRKNSIMNPVALTNSNAEKLSRHDLLEWVNTTINGKYKKIEDLCTGVAYCQLMELLFPNCIGLKRVKINAKLEHEYLHNLKLFQGGFTKVQYDKTVPIEKLIKGRFQDNFEFLQWFKKYFDANSPSKENEKPSGTPLLSKEPHKKTQNITETGISKNKTPPNQPELQQNSPSNERVLQDEINLLMKRGNTVETERNTYYKKLTEIEALLLASVKNNENVEWAKHALKILYQANKDSPVASPESL